MGQYVNFLERAVSSDYTNEMDFTGQTDKWLYKQNNRSQVLRAQKDKHQAKTI